MAFDLEIDAELVFAYLDPARGNFSRVDFLTIFDFLGTIEENGQRYCDDVSYRYAPNSPMLAIDFCFMDTSEKFRHLRFIVDDASKVFGVLRVRFVDEF